MNSNGMKFLKQTRLLLISASTFLHKNLIPSLMDSSIETQEKVESLKRPLENKEDEEAVKAKCLKVDRIKRRKVALLIAYSGQGYLGMQRNPETKTIEEDLLVALLKAGFITDEAFTTPQTIQFQRAARTDKGVSAAKQILSLKLPEEATTDAINIHLPPQIRTFAIRRATKGFNSKGNCDARTYSYTLPTFAFSDSSSPVDEHYRLPIEHLEKINKVLKMFEGTHNFHNFTSKKKPQDPSNQRYIMSFNCSEPFEMNNLELCIIKIKGQSFMLHQIRKMVGLSLGIIKGLTDEEAIYRSWNYDRIDIPMAPGLGLVLEELHYDRYNKRYGKDGIHEPLQWDEYERELTEFKKEFILPEIIKTELETKSMLKWLETLPLHTFSTREQRNNNSVQDSNDSDSNSSPSVAS